MGDLLTSSGLIAVVALVGLVVPSIVALAGFDAKWSEQKKRLMASTLTVGFCFGLFGVVQQYLKGDADALEAARAKNDRKAAESERDAAKEGRRIAQAELATIREQLSNASIDINQLKLLDPISPSTKFYVQLSADKSLALACMWWRIVGQRLPGSTTNGSIRIIQVNGEQPYRVIFGKQLSLNEAHAYLKLATDFKLSGSDYLPVKTDAGHLVELKCPVQ